MATKDEALRWLTESAEASRKAADDLLVTVSHARRAGASWSEIGAILGTTKQAAHERYG